jgi:hypothetical protein
MAQVFNVIMDRGIKVIIEQPSNSPLFTHPDLEDMVRSFPDFFIVSTYMGFSVTLCRSQRGC